MADDQNNENRPATTFSFKDADEVVDEKKKNLRSNEDELAADIAQGGPRARELWKEINELTDAGKILWLKRHGWTYDQNFDLFIFTNTKTGNSYANLQDALREEVQCQLGLIQVHPTE